MYDFPFLCSEADDSSCMIRLLFRAVLFYDTIGNGSLIRERFVEFDHEIILEVSRNTTAVLGRVTDNTVVSRINLDIRTLVESIHHYVGMFIFRESKAEHGSPFCRSQLGHDIVFCQIHLIIIGFCRFTLVRKPACTLVFVEFRLIHHRHDRELAIVVYPRTGLVRLLESADFRCRILIHPAVAHLSSLRAPEVHTPRTCDSRIRIACR